MHLSTLRQVNTREAAVYGDGQRRDVDLSQMNVDLLRPAYPRNRHAVNYRQAQFCRQEAVDTGLSSPGVNQGLKRCSLRDRRYQARSRLVVRIEPDKHGQGRSVNNQQVTPGCP